MQQLEVNAVSDIIVQPKAGVSNSNCPKGQMRILNITWWLNYENSYEYDKKSIKTITVLERCCTDAVSLILYRSAINRDNKVKVKYGKQNH